MRNPHFSHMIEVHQNTIGFLNNVLHLGFFSLFAVIIINVVILFVYCSMEPKLQHMVNHFITHGRYTGHFY